MKHLLLTTIAAVLVVGCGESQQSVPQAESEPVESVAEVPAKPSNSEADRALLKAAKEGNIEAVKQHLADGAEVNAKNKFSSTPLHSAAWLGHREIVGLLIHNGADVNAKADNGITPLHHAAYSGRKEIVELLIAEGASVNTQAAFPGWTPLDVAIINKKTETANLLRKHGGKTGEELKAKGK